MSLRAAFERWARAASIAGLAAAMVPAAVQAQPIATRGENASATESLMRKHRFADCVAREHRALVVAVLEQVAGSPSEGRAFAALRTAWTDAAERGTPSSCSIQITGGNVASTPASLRGPLAEALRSVDFAVPALSRRGQRAAASLARIPAGLGADDAVSSSRQEEDGFRRFAACAAARAPAVPAILLATTPGGADERQQFETLVAAQENCFGGAGGYDVNIPTLRGAVAEAAYRNAAAAARGETISAPAPVARARAERLVIDEQLAGTAAAPGGSRRLDHDDARAINEFAQCAADSLPQVAAQALANYLAGDDGEDGLYRLAQRRWGCSPEDRPLLFSRALFAGGVAEALLKRASADAVPVPAQASGTTTTTRSQPEQVAGCIARTAPAAVARLLATQPASADEMLALDTVLPTGEACVPRDYRVNTSRSALRAQVAIAAYRLAVAGPTRGN